MLLRSNRNLRIFFSLILLFAGSVPLEGCLKEWDSEEVKSWYDENPTSFEGYMEEYRKTIQAGRSERAKKYLKDAIGFVESQYGSEDARIATAADELGLMLEKEGNFSEAAEVYRKAYVARKGLLRKGSPDLVRTQKKLAEMLLKLNRRDEAQAITDELDDKKSQKDSKEIESAKPADSKESGKRRKRVIE